MEKKKKKKKKFNIIYEFMNKFLYRTVLALSWSPF